MFANVCFFPGRCWARWSRTLLSFYLDFSLLKFQMNSVDSTRWVFSLLNKWNRSRFHMNGVIIPGWCFVDTEWELSAGDQTEWSTGHFWGEEGLSTAQGWGDKGQELQDLYQAHPCKCCQSFPVYEFHFNSPHWGKWNWLNWNGILYSLKPMTKSCARQLLYSYKGHQNTVSCLYCHHLPSASY